MLRGFDLLLLRFRLRMSFSKIRTVVPERGEVASLLSCLCNLPKGMP